MIVQILNGEEVIREIDENSETLLNRARLDAEVMNRELDGEFSARFTPEIIPERIRKVIPDEPA